jgi:S1-C subfamily serine protease
MLAGFILAALIGGVAGGLIVRATWGSGNGNSSSQSAAANGTAAACRAANVADKALPSVVTVRANNGESGGTGSGVVLRTGTSGRPARGRARFSARALQHGHRRIVSALDRYVRVPSENGQAHLVGAIQTDASINPGNSGGALVDCSARLVGINTAGAAVPNSGGGSIVLGFAIPINLANAIADELIANGRVTRPGFGMQLQAVPQELAQATGGTAGLVVAAVSQGGPADEAGIRPGDVIVEIDGEPAPASTT